MAGKVVAIHQPDEQVTLRCDPDLLIRHAWEQAVRGMLEADRERLLALIP